jgi:hypothetical protein
MAVAPGPVRLSRVFDQRHLVARGDVSQAPHVGELAVEMDGDDKARPVVDRIGRRGRIEVVISLRDVDGNRHAARLGDRFEGRDERVRGDDHAVAGLQIRGDQCEA